MVNTNGKLNPNTIIEKKNKIAGILLSAVGDTWEEQFDKLFSNEYLAFGVYKENIKEFIALVQSSERTKTAEDICKMIDLFESQAPSTLEQWKEYKKIRNAIRDKYILKPGNPGESKEKYGK